jgi:anti-anti-sigma regulatory factor
MTDAPFIVVDDADRPGSSRLLLRGRIRIADATGLHRAALDLAARGGNVAVDCGGAEYLDPAAIQVVLGLGRELTGRGRRCDVTGVTGPLAEEFRLAGLAGAAGGVGR